MVLGEWFVKVNCWLFWWLSVVFGWCFVICLVCLWNIDWVRVCFFDGLCIRFSGFKCFFVWFLDVVNFLFMDLILVVILCLCEVCSLVFWCRFKIFVIVLRFGVDLWWLGFCVGVNNVIFWVCCILCFLYGNNLGFRIGCFFCFSVRFLNVVNGLGLCLFLRIIVWLGIRFIKIYSWWCWCLCCIIICLIVVVLCIKGIGFNVCNIIFWIFIWLCLWYSNGLWLFFCCF